MFGTFKLKQPITTNSITSNSPSEPSRIIPKYISSIPKYIKPSNNNEISTISSTITDVYDKPAATPSSSSSSINTDYMKKNNKERKRNTEREKEKEKEKIGMRFQQNIEDDYETKINELYRQHGLPSEYIDIEKEKGKTNMEYQQNIEDDDETKINNLYKKFGILSTYNDTKKEVIDMEDSDDSGDNYIDEEFENDNHEYDEKDDGDDDDDDDENDEDTYMNDNSNKNKNKNKNKNDNKDDNDDKGKKRIIRIQRKKHPLDAKHHIYNNARKMDRQYEITIEKELDQLLDAILPVKKK
ncbi:unnamed protein product [Cunninghamella echinulata]